MLNRMDAAAECCRKQEADVCPKGLQLRVIGVDSPVHQVPPRRQALRGVLGLHAQHTAPRGGACQSFSGTVR